MSNKVKDELEHFKKRVEAAIIDEYEWFVSWSAENIETDLKEHFEAKETELITIIKRHEDTINTFENQVEEMQKALEEIEFQTTITEDVEVFRKLAQAALKGVETN